MPTSIATTFIAFGAVLTAVDGTAGAIVAGVGVLWELAVRYAFSGDFRDARIDVSE